MTHSRRQRAGGAAAAGADARRHLPARARTTPSAAPSIAAAEKLAAELRALPRDEFFGYEPISVKIDTTFDKQPGFRFAEYELRGVPVRVEIGPKDIEKAACVVARRDVPGKEGKQFGVPLDGGRGRTSTSCCATSRQSLFDRAKAFRDARIVTANTLDEFKALFPREEGEGGRHRAAEVRVRPLGRHAGDGGPGAEGVRRRRSGASRSTARRRPGTCMFTGKPSARRVVFARAY